jgi:AhpD family alkylhydroperoxidase
MFGAKPNLFTTAANSPVALGALVSMFANVGQSSFGPKVGELFGIAIAESNRCAYCLAAHTAIGRSMGITPIALASAREAESVDRHTRAALKLAVAINKSRGHIDDVTLASARSAGLSDAEILEVIAHVALNVFTNYLNTVARTALDFPEVDFAAAA